MTERPRFFDDLAGVAGGALSVLGGLRDEAESLVRSQVEEAIRKLDLVRQSEFLAVQELAARARAEQETTRAELDETRVRLAAIEARLVLLEAKRGQPSHDTEPSSTSSDIG